MRGIRLRRDFSGGGARAGKQQTRRQNRGGTRNNRDSQVCLRHHDEYIRCLSCRIRQPFDTQAPDQGAGVQSR